MFNTIFTWFATVLTVIGAASVIVIATVNPELHDGLAQKDGPEGAGLYENLTVVVMLAGVIVAIAGLFLSRGLQVPKSIRIWLLMWILAGTYFAGEECSWGQWYFGWETPEALAELNDQGETNLHNISSWFDQKPRAAVETFIIFVGLLIPVFLNVKRRQQVPADSLLAWIIAPSACWAAAAVFLVMRLSRFVDHPVADRLGTSELRELAIAWFLSLYLISYTVRFVAQRQQYPASARFIASPEANTSPV